MAGHSEHTLRSMLYKWPYGKDCLFLHQAKIRSHSASHGCQTTWKFLQWQLRS